MLPCVLAFTFTLPTTFVTLRSHICGCYYYVAPRYVWLVTFVVITLRSRLHTLPVTVPVTFVLRLRCVDLRCCRTLRCVYVWLLLQFTDLPYTAFARCRYRLRLFIWLRFVTLFTVGRYRLLITLLPRAFTRSFCPRLRLPLIY